MKYYVAGSLLVAVGLLAYTNASFNQSSTPENITVQSATVSGNITDKRLSADGELVVAAKNVLKTAVNKNRVLYLNRVVDYDSAQELTDQIKKLQANSSEPIWLLIDSPGGSILDGATLISEMEASKAPVYTVCTRLCASMAAMIHSYGVKRYATDRAILMYHPASAGAQGQVPNMLSQLTTITRYVDKIVANVVKRSKVTLDEYNKLVAYELWIDAEDASAKGLVDGIVNLNVANYPEPALKLSPALPQPNEDRGNRNRKTFDVQMISPNVYLWEHNAGKTKK
jgi:ATP-dependent Clp protease protease subunit